MPREDEMNKENIRKINDENLLKGHHLKDHNFLVWFRLKISLSSHFLGLAFPSGFLWFPFFSL